jgi:hypothetical protein
VIQAHVHLEVARWRHRRPTRAELDEREVLELFERFDAARVALETLGRA